MSESSLAELLRSRGLRLTAQRQLVLRAVLDLGHATPEQVHTAVREVVTVPVIASGGAAAVGDFAPAVAAGADAVLAASVFHFGTMRIGDAKAALREAGYAVR